MDNITIPFSFFKEHNIVLSTKEIDFAISRRLIDLQDLENIVDASLVKYPNDKYLLKIALDILLNGSYLNPHIQYLEKDYNGEDRENGTILSDNNSVNNKWRYIILLWLFIHRTSNDTDYDLMNSVYANFDYPSDMVSFVSYMPAFEISKKEGYENILDNWQKYLSTYNYLLKQ